MKCPFNSDHSCTGRHPTPRSVEQHRRYFAVIRAAFANWPEAHEVQFATETECRKWLEMKAGYRELALRLPLRGMKPDAVVPIAQAAMQAAGSHAIASAHKGELIVWRPKSIAFHTMGQAAFNRLNEAVAAVIRDEMHVTADELLEASELAA